MKRRLFDARGRAEAHLAACDPTGAFCCIVNDLAHTPETKGIAAAFGECAMVAHKLPERGLHWRIARLVGELQSGSVP